MGTQLIQPSMSGGEMSEELAGRVDLARYGISLRKCRNFIVQPFGGIVNRPGFEFLVAAKHADKAMRVIPFIVSEDTAYVVELGDFYMRFLYRGALVRDGMDAIVEVATPWPEAVIFRVKFTQSADVMTLTHPDYPTQELRRLTATSFELREFSFTDGPFAPMNANESLKVAASAVEGNVTITANANIFTADLVDSLLYIEQKELREVKPWIPDEKNLPLGSIRRSDGKYYKAVSVPNITGLAGTPYYLNGNVRPTHEFGRAFDGPQDTRTDGTNEYKAGIEWEYLHGGFGIVRITGYTNATTVTGVVTRRLPEAVVGGLASPGATYTLSGDGTTKQFSIAGAVAPSARDYVVTIGGTPVTASPFQPPQNTGGQVPTGPIATLEP